MNSVSNICSILAILLAATLSPAQDNPTAKYGSNRVYVVEFEEVTPESATAGSSSGNVNARDIVQLTTNIIRLRLEETPTLEIIATDTEHQCGGDVDQGENNATKTPVQGTAQAQHGNRQRAVIEPKGAEFFQVRGSVEVHPPNIAVNYWLEKCDGRVLKKLDADRTILMADRSSLLAETVLGQISAISQFFAYKLENPPTTVAVEQFSNGGKLAADLTKYLKQLLTSMPAFELSETNKNPDYIIDGDVTAGQNEIRAEIRVRSAHGDSPVAIEVRGTRKLQWDFERRVAGRAFGALNDMRLAQRYGWDALSATSFEKLLEEGKHLLCEDQPGSCRQDPWAAVRVFEAARKSPKADWNASYYLGMAQAANYKYSDAVKSLTGALSQISASPVKGAEKNRAMVQVHNTLGDVYLRYGDAKNGVVQYEESLKIDPGQPEVYVKGAEALFVDDRPGAIQIFVDGIRRMPSEDKLHAALLENLRKLQDGDFKTVEEQFERASAAGIPINDEYALLWVLWGETGLVNADAVRQKKYVTNALDLHPADAEVQAEAYALRAAIDLPGNLDVADKFLTLAEQLPKEKLAGNTLGWLARLRGIYFLDRKNYAQATEWAEKARPIDGSSASDLLGAQVANSWAKSLRDLNPKDEQASKLFARARNLARPLVDSRYDGADSVLQTANHGLGLDEESKKAFKAIIDKNPQDFSAILSLAFVCNEYLFDTACSYTESKKLLSLDLGALSPSDSAAMKLNAAEAAVLQREYQQAGSWLNELALPDLDADYRAIADFYKFWVAFASNQADARDDFDHLRQSLTVYAESQRKPDAQPSGWSFQGARHALARSALSPQKQKVLSDVITALEDPSKDVAAIQLPSETSRTRE